MLAVAGRVEDIGDGYAFEFKWDGVRALACTDGEHLALRSRRGDDVTARYPELAGLAAAIGRPAVVDGEIVAFDAAGRPSFERLQRRMNLADRGRVAAAARDVPVAFVAFDLLAVGDTTVTGEPYERRRERLADLGLTERRWQTPPTGDDLAAMLTVAGDLGLEGVVAKRLGSTYQPGRRSPDWRKVRLGHRQELVVGGYKPGRGARAGSFGSLLVGYHDYHGRLRYAGKVGSGYSDRELEGLLAAMRPRPSSPFADPVDDRDAVFVEPDVVVEVRFSEWTGQGRLRQPVYLGRRDDKSPHEVVREP